MLCKILIYIALFSCLACQPTRKTTPELVLPVPSHLDNILQKGSLDISTFYNTTDYYVYQGITRGFHYDLAKDFANYLGVKLQIVEVNNNIDTAIERLHEGRYDLLAVSVSQTPEHKTQLRFSQPFFQTGKVLIQKRGDNPIKNMTELNGKEVFIPKSANSYKKVLQEIQDSLNIRIYVTESEQYSNEDLMHLVETGEIQYTMIEENVAQASSFSMHNIDYSLKLKENISVSWATNPNAKSLIVEINAWLDMIRKNGKLNYLYRRYFNNESSTPHHTSKYLLLKKGVISPFDDMLKSEAKRVDVDWKLLAAVVFAESRFDPEAESSVGAYGLMQITPETAEHFGVYDYFRPDSNLYVGASYLRYLDEFLTSYVPDVSERVKFVLASYNAGPGHVLDAIRLTEKYGKNPQIWDNQVEYYLRNKSQAQFYEDPVVKNGYCNGGQTYHFVLHVLDIYNHYKNIK